MVRRFWEGASALMGVDGIRLLGLLLALMCCCLGFVVLSSEIAEQETQSFNETVVLALRRPDNPTGV
jgi:undecaprenyl-diphosphatase